jgi:flavin reductase (DIM6/NTAB) family NADH-FMN oxidoreductase RutF
MNVLKVVSPVSTIPIGSRKRVFMSSFKDMRIVDNFYQTSAFYPMPTILVSTLSEDGKTSIGSYSLCFPYYIAGKSYYAMILECRNSSNTAQNILKTGKCALNFIEDSRKDFKEAVRLGFPGETSAEKMASCKFELEVGQADCSEAQRPLIVSKAYQVFECTWDSSLEHVEDDCKRIGQLEGIEPPYHDFNGITSKFGCHFILKIDKILMKEKFYNAIINGVKASTFPRVPVDYGYRDSTHFWYTRFRRPIAEKVPVGKEADIQSVMYAANRLDPEIKFTEGACKTVTKVPRIFLKVVLQQCIDWAKENNVKEIDETHMKIINDKRNAEKKR